MEIITKDIHIRPEIKYYDLERLRAENSDYDRQHKVTQYDVNKVNRLMDCVQGRICIGVAAGDRVRAVGKRNSGEERVYKNALIENTFDGRVSMCMEPYVPFTVEQDGVVRLSSSGGYWLGEKDFSRFKQLGYVMGEFKTWGHCGVCGGGAVYFNTWVNYWQYINKDKIY